MRTVKEKDLVIFGLFIALFLLILIMGGCGTLTQKDINDFNQEVERNKNKMLEPHQIFGK